MQIMPITPINQRFTQKNDKSVKTNAASTSLVLSNNYTPVSFMAKAQANPLQTKEVKNILKALNERGVSNYGSFVLFNDFEPLIKKFPEDIRKIIADKVENTKGNQVYRIGTISDIYKILGNFTTKTFGFFKTLYERKTPDGSIAFNDSCQYKTLSDCRKNAKMVTDTFLDAKTLDGKPRIMSTYLINKFCEYYKKYPHWQNLSKAGLKYILSIKDGDKLLDESELERFTDLGYYRLFKMYNDTGLFDYKQMYDMSATCYSNLKDFEAKSEIVNIKMNQKDHPDLAEEIKLLTTCSECRYHSALLMAKAGYNSSEIKKYWKDEADLSNAEFNFRTEKLSKSEYDYLQSRIIALKEQMDKNKTDLYRRIQMSQNG